jgi:hypothetical protein
VAIRRVGDLEIDEDLAFQRRSWAVQRAGWVAMGSVLVLAAAGLLGSGPLSRQNVVVPGLSVEYKRFTRYETPETLTVRVDPAATRAPDVRLWVDRRYLERVVVESVVPAPLRVEAAAEQLVYVFPMSRPGERITIAFRLQAEHIGPAQGRIGLVGAEPVAAFRQFVYP